MEVSMKRKLTRLSLFNSLKKTANRIPEHRKVNAPNYKYPITSAVMTAFGAFYFHHPSLRSHENTLKQETYRKNFKDLFYREPILNSQTVRNILDPIDEHCFTPAFDDIFKKLDRSGLFEKLYFNQQTGILLSGDGVDYYSSEEISCKNCSCAKHNKGTEKEYISYSHKMFNVGIVHPEENLFFPLSPEFITPQDGCKKQDCELNAAKRWLKSFRKRHKTVKATLQVDSIHCNHETLKLFSEYRVHFIASCKKGNNKTLYDYIETAQNGGDTNIVEEERVIKSKKRIFRYEYLNGVPIRFTKDALKVNFIRMMEIDGKTRKVLKKFDYVTDLILKEKNVKELALAGRKRWKVENEGHNVLKNQGYYFDHNYGHGKNHLSAVIAVLILLSFLIHAILRLIGEDGIVSVLRNCHARKKGIELLRNIMQILKTERWETLYITAMRALEKS